MKSISFSSLLTIILVVTTFLVGKAQQKIVYSADLVQLHQNIWTDILKGSSERENVQNLMEKLNEKGQWPDIDYASKQRGNWHPASHLSRLQGMAKAWQKEGSAYYHDTALLAKIHLAYNYWIDNDLQCPNWWYPEIGVPMSLAPTMILLEKELSKEQMSGGIIKSKN